MAVYGQLTKSRPQVTTSDARNLNNINEMYDYHLLKLVNMLPDGLDTYFISKLTNSGVFLKDNIFLYDTDAIAIQVKSVKDTSRAALAVIRRYQRLMRENEELFVEYQATLPDDDFECVLESIPNSNFDIQYSAIGKIEDIIDNRNYFDEVLTDNNIIKEQQDFQQYLDPRFIFDDIKSTIQDKYGTYLPMDIMNGYLMKGDASKPFSESQTQNIYTNYFGREQSFYNVSDISSKSIESVTGFAETSSISQGSSGLNSGLVKNTSKISNAVNLMSNANLFGAFNRPQQVNPLSNSGSSNTQQIFTEEEMNQKTSYSKRMMNTTSVKTQNGQMSQAIIQRVLPLQFDTGIAGNEFTADTDAQFTATISRVIDGNGISKNLSYDVDKVVNKKVDNTSIDGSFKFRNNSRSIPMSRRLAKYTTSTAITNPLSVPANTIIVYNGSVDLLTNPRQGQLGVETFEDEGYDGWYLGERTPILLVNLDNDIGFDSFDLGTSYSSGNIETFDIGWAEGTSPYSRKGEDSTFSDDITPQIDGSKTVFITTYPYIKGTLQVLYNGVEQVLGTTFTETSSTSFTLSFTALSGDFLVVVYQRFYDSSPTQEEYANNRSDLRKQANQNSLINTGSLQSGTIRY